MTLCVYFVCLIGVATGTGVRGIATLGASRICYNAGVRMLMSLRCNFDNITRSNIVNMDIDDVTAKLGIGIIDLFHTIGSNIFTVSKNGYLHDKRLIVQLQACIEVFIGQSGTGRTFHSSYAIANIVGNIYVVIRCIERTIIADRRFKCVCKDLHTLEIGMQPVFHQILEVRLICHDTGVFNINQCRVKTSRHLSDIRIKFSGLMDTRSEGKQRHHIDLGVGISLLHLMEGDRIGLHGVLGLCVSKRAVTVIADQCSKVYSFIASQHRLIIGAILDLCISSVDLFRVLKVIGTHVNNDDIGFLTAVLSGIVVELNNTVFIHTGCAVLPEFNGTSRPGVIYQDIGTQLFSCLIDPDVLCFSNFARTQLDWISFRVVLSACHGEPYTAAGQCGVCSTGRYTV